MLLLDDPKIVLCDVRKAEWVFRIGKNRAVLHLETRVGLSWTLRSNRGYLLSTFIWLLAPKLEFKRFQNYANIGQPRFHWLYFFVIRERLN